MARGEGARRFKALMAALPRDLRRALEAELERQATALVAAQRRAVPVRKGALRASIRAEATLGKALSVTILAGGQKTTKPVRRGQSVAYDYALGQEFGNRKNRPRPFFYPTYRAKKPAIRRGIGKAVRETVQAAVKRG